MRTMDYVAAIRAKTKTGSDYAVAKALQVSEQAVYGYRNGAIMASAKVCVRVAQILGIPLLTILDDLQKEREERDASDPTRVLEERGRALRQYELLPHPLRLSAPSGAGAVSKGRS